MSQPKRRLIERVLDEGYLQGLPTKSLEDLRQMRVECRQAEADVSFERRVCQARIDILEAELDRRASGATNSDLVARLPQILAAESETLDDGAGALPNRAPDFSIPRSAEMPHRRLEEIMGEHTLAHLPQLQTEELRGILTSLADYEAELSARRRAMHEVVDAIQREIVRRYVTGTASPEQATS